MNRQHYTYSPRKILLHTLLTFFLCTNPAFATKTYILYGLDYAPYSYMDKNGEVHGLSVDAARQIMTEAGLKHQVVMRPWSRSLREAEKGNNTFAIGLARLTSREEKFDWVAKVPSLDYYLFAHVDDRRPVTFDAIKQGKFTGVCVEVGVSCAIMRWIGFPEENLFKRGHGSFEIVYMINYRRVDLYIADILHHPYQIKGLDLQKDQTKPVLQVPVYFEYYLAASKHIDPEVRETIRTAYKRLVDRGAIKYK